MNDISFKYIFGEDYNPQYVNGAIGGVGPQGEIIIHFYCERSAIPYKVEHNVNEDGYIGSPIEVEPKDVEKQYVRGIQSGIILDKKHAIDIYNWLGAILKVKDERNDGNAE